MKFIKLNGFVADSRTGAGNMWEFMIKYLQNVYCSILAPPTCTNMYISI